MKMNIKRLMKLVMLVLLLTAAILGLTISVSAEGESKRLNDLAPGTIVKFAGQDWILLEPGTGYVLRKEVLPYELPVYELDRYQSLDEDGDYTENIGEYLNGTLYELEARTDGTGYLEKMSSDYPWEVSKIIPCSWSNESEAGDWSYPGDTLKISLLIYSDYQKYKDLIQANPVNKNWWLRTYSEKDSYHLWYVTPDGSLGTAHECDDIGQVPRPVMCIDPYVTAAYVKDGCYRVNKDCQKQAFAMKVTPAAGYSPYSYAASVVASPSQADGSIALKISNGALSAPDVYSDAPTGDGVIASYLSSSLFNAHAGDYVGIYDLNKDGKVIGFNQIQLTASDFGSISDYKAIISPNGGGPFNVSETKEVTIITPPGYTAYYTTDGSDPKDSGTKVQYEKSFTIGQPGVPMARTGVALQKRPLPSSRMSAV